MINLVIKTDLSVESLPPTSTKMEVYFSGKIKEAFENNLELPVSEFELYS